MVIPPNPVDASCRFMWYFEKRLFVNERLASCQWGAATAHWVGMLTEMYVIHMELLGPTV